MSNQTVSVEMFPRKEIRYAGDFRSVQLSTMEELIANPNRADHLRDLFNEHVKNDGHWKGACMAIVPEELADDVVDAMVFMGALPFVVSRCKPMGDEWPDAHLGRHRETKEEISFPQKPGHVVIRSKGYWACGF